MDYETENLIRAWRAGTIDADGLELLREELPEGPWAECQLWVCREYEAQHPR
jgi:hypothetical protein